ncbi:4-hydroxythreonine-4-phosphate dehydrogenase PdxA [Lichenicola cladoniae]|uniref:4-hydroxythreonine-4-phosphate dehydrogenase n=1 Tax=Lichenicola cladoniae TaxID=1484109 RepID=A0A6M8HL76_9PROT|nr:4-hydroxythreonine-4-phosphate dehydrogenase PdxA [Lichenicola cladoniae]NPD69285.1 4-hydroxythreonine-4-phosphate dehydrogenase PdxA [Acetobacteraceae bacterium]QKE89101.1 4-hydroxythreonine-4-phosphate dehydrogenase PdxA [Lichenicola cladoniae]
MLALTMGDPAGVGPEITLWAWHALRRSGPSFVLLADPDWIASIAHGVATIRPVASIAEARAVFHEALPVMAVSAPLGSTPVPGHPDPGNAGAITASIADAVRLAMAGDVDGVVTNPIAKAVLKQAGFPYPGHTEYLAALTDASGREVMMLAGPSLRVVPVTIHVSLREAIERLSTDEIVRVSLTTVASLSRDFGIARPRLAVAGLNPHAGEDGHMGAEDIDIIRPAIERLRGQGIDVVGPMPPDTMFTAPARARYDVAVCMYHDQALIPLKTLDMAQGVNVTLGLDLVRTSPDHGTAFDIAGQGVADPASLIAALRLAGSIAEHRKTA